MSEDATSFDAWQQRWRRRAGRIAGAVMVISLAGLAYPTIVYGLRGLTSAEPVLEPSDLGPSGTWRYAGEPVAARRITCRESIFGDVRSPWTYGVDLVPVVATGEPAGAPAKLLLMLVPGEQLTVGDAELLLCRDDIGCPTPAAREVGATLLDDLGFCRGRAALGAVVEGAQLVARRDREPGEALTVGVVILVIALAAAWLLALFVRYAFGVFLGWVFMLFPVAPDELLRASTRRARWLTVAVATLLVLPLLTPLLLDAARHLDGSKRAELRMASVEAAAACDDLTVSLATDASGARWAVWYEELSGDLPPAPALLKGYLRPIGVEEGCAAVESVSAERHFEWQSRSPASYREQLVGVSIAALIAGILLGLPLHMSLLAASLSRRRRSRLVNGPPRR